MQTKVYIDFFIEKPSLKTRKQTHKEKQKNEF